MRILYHHRTRAEDGSGIHIYEMVKAFRDLGHDVETVALVKPDGASVKRIPRGLWRCLGSWRPSWLYEVMTLAYNLYGYRSLCRAIRSKRPNFIYERYSLNTFCGIWASRRFGIPLVLEVNLPLFYENSQFGHLIFEGLARFSERWICSHSTWTIVVSRAMREFMVQAGVPAEKIVVMPNGVDPQRFHPHVSGEAVRRRYGLEGTLVLGFVGWFREWHRVEMLLEVMHDAHLAEKGIRLLLIGDGPAYRFLYQYAEEHNLRSAVIFTGPVARKDMPAHIAAIDIAVLPGTNDYGCPMKLLEYMAMGKCIVAPDQAPVREILDGGATGFLFQAQDKESLQSTLHEVLENPEKRAGAGQMAYETIYGRGLLWRANAERTLNLVFGPK